MNTALQLHFHKYQGTGNDFVLIDNRQLTFPKKNTKLVAQLCDRKFGIGADGLILLENDSLADFRMVYYNSDGNESTMCGNGGRCIVAFANALGVIGNETNFIAVDGMHWAQIKEGVVTLGMSDVTAVQTRQDSFFLNTGSPHHVQEVTDVDSLNVKREGAKLRFGLYGAAGSNINFVQQMASTTFKVRTYERGVEDETLSCGTGVTAVAIAMYNAQKTSSTTNTIMVEGGQLQVVFTYENGTYRKVQLIGPATLVFKGEMECKI